MNSYNYLDLLSELGINSAHPGGMERTSNMLADEPIQKGMKVLDVGCGTGETSLFLKNNYQCKVHALENHPVMLQKAKERVKNESDIEVIEGSIENMPFSDHTYDYIICESVLVFVHVKKALDECFRVLKKNGTFIMNEMAITNVLDESSLNRFKEFYCVTELNNKEQWKNKMLQAGFKRVEEMYVESITSEQVSINLSPDIDPSILELLDQHQKLQQEFERKIGHVIYSCCK
ncbi:methyltransferase domain-containing protein [Alkalihalobacillus sp. MEB130]|uniref:class I SAM-dependent methyltransferase n=1 Tax=Alkalihalobacillus sp. MEB130 TaxID=2976704 RepID=UPI0028DE421F|nr:methyltransferase domain-containing protein [Alkalihalobacillus sp. MEB130]MDT8860684.1 methyltransferase domain-containing protein [Alkalihalobacillus sp. MEB130]